MPLYSRSHTAQADRPKPCHQCKKAILKGQRYVHLDDFYDQPGGRGTNIGGFQFKAVRANWERHEACPPSRDGACSIE